MNESNPSDAALAELLTLTVEVGAWGETSYRNHLGLFHRVHGPAVIYPSGIRKWYLNGQQLLQSVHRERLNALSRRSSISTT